MSGFGAADVDAIGIDRRDGGQPRPDITRAGNVLELLGRHAGRDGGAARVHEDRRGRRGSFLGRCGRAKCEDDPGPRASHHVHSLGRRRCEAGERARQCVCVDRQILKMRLALWVGGPHGVHRSAERELHARQRASRRILDGHVDAAEEHLRGRAGDSATQHKRQQQRGALPDRTVIPSTFRCPTVEGLSAARHARLLKEKGATEVAPSVSQWMTN